MKSKVNIKKKIICILFIIILLGTSFIGYISNAADEDEISYKIEQVTSSSDINSNNLYNYILVYRKNDDGRYVAIASTLSSSGRYYMSTENWAEVEINGDTLTEYSDKNILWNFTKSNKSVLEDGDCPVIASAVEMYPGRTHLKLSSGGNGGSTGIRYSANGNGFTFEEAGDGTFYLSENNCETSNHYIGIGSRGFAKSSRDNAAEFSIYKVIKKYNYTSSKFLSSEETAEIEDATISKQISEYENYEDTAIAEIKLSTIGTEYEKTCDIVLILDDSTTVYTMAPENSDKTRAEIIREDALLFAEKILEINPENRISVIKFGRDITNEDIVDSYLFSSDIDEIEEMIGGDKDSNSPGTDYGLAFKKANEMMEEYSDPNHGKVIIFLSDGMPSIYNGISAPTFSNTSDSEGYATNWVNYVTNTPLQEAELMKETGTAIYTIGSIEEDTSMNNSDVYIIPAGTTKNVLENIANGKSNFYDFDKIETQLEEIFETIAKDFNYYPTNARVEDYLTVDVNLLTKNVQGYVPKVVFKRGDVEIEAISFNEDGTKAYSSLQPDTNILNGNSFEGMYISFDNGVIKWNIGDLYKYEYTLEFPIYLNNTVDLYGEGKSRPTGDYDISETTKLIYTDVTNREVTRDVDLGVLSWNNPTDDSSMVIDEDKEEEIPTDTNQEIAHNIKTGDNTLFIGIGILLLSLGINIYKRKFSKASRKNKSVIY